MWTVILTTILQVVGWLMRRAEVSDEIKKNFFEWIKKVGADTGSVKLMKDGDEGLEWLKDHPWEESV